jgi:DNA-binding NtrC family response regulator
MLESVLLVDDDEDLRAAMQEVLHDFGVRRLVEAGSLRDVEEHREEALACELALVDINLGYGQPTGVDVFEWFEREGFAGRVVFLTGHGSRDPRVQQAAGLTGSQIVSKPLSTADLASVIAGVSPAS